MQQREVPFNFDYYKKLANNTISDATFIANRGSENVPTYRDKTGASAFYGNGSGNTRAGMFPTSKSEG